MTYSEIVKKIQAHESLSVQDVTAEQMFRLYLDRHLKYINYEENIYEFNLIALDEETRKNHVYALIKADDSFRAFAEIAESFVKESRAGKRSFLVCDHKEYEVVLELMETKE